MLRAPAKTLEITASNLEKNGERRTKPIAVREYAVNNFGNAVPNNDTITNIQILWDITIIYPREKRNYHVKTYT